MSDNCKKKNGRVLKTKKELLSALAHLLELYSFDQITVNDLCGQAMVSRTTFYSHFNDKYDLLKHWLAGLKPAIVYQYDTYDAFEEAVNRFADQHQKTIGNLIENPNSETFALLCDFTLALLDMTVNETDDEQGRRKQIVLSQFCAGGIMHYLLYQVKNKFPDDLPMMNPYFFNILINLKKWE